MEALKLPNETLQAHWIVCNTLIPAAMPNSLSTADSFIKTILFVLNFKAINSRQFTVSSECFRQYWLHNRHVHNFGSSLKGQGCLLTSSDNVIDCNSAPKGSIHAMDSPGQ